MKNIDLLGFRKVRVNKIKIQLIVKIEINRKLCFKIKKKIKKFKLYKKK